MEHDMTNNRPQKEIFSRSAGLPFSHALGYGDLVFISGTIGRDPATKLIALGDVAAQTRQTIENIKVQLELAGTSLDKVVKTTVYLVDMASFGTMNEVYREYFALDPPARSTLGISCLPEKECLVEIEVIAGR
jgi:2-iminobutanoate/2-iminopropanoate deaminase